MEGGGELLFLVSLTLRVAFESWLRAPEARAGAESGGSVPFCWSGRFYVGVLEAARRGSSPCPLSLLESSRGGVLLAWVFLEGSLGWKL